jgi:hypothetical protein
LVINKYHERNFLTDLFGGGDIGLKPCFHIPWITTCDNSADVDDVKNALNDMKTEVRAELDNIKAVEDNRWSQLNADLSNQRTLIQQVLL